MSLVLIISPTGSLPVRYLKVSLITKKLFALDYEALVAKVAGRIDSWLIKHLSFAGRLQLFSSILFSAFRSTGLRCLFFLRR